MDLWWFRNASVLVISSHVQICRTVKRHMNYNWGEPRYHKSVTHELSIKVGSIHIFLSCNSFSVSKDLIVLGGNIILHIPQIFAQNRRLTTTTRKIIMQIVLKLYENPKHSQREQKTFGLYNWPPYVFLRQTILRRSTLKCICILSNLLQFFVVIWDEMLIWVDNMFCRHVQLSTWYGMEHRVDMGVVVQIIDKVFFLFYRIILSRRGSLEINMYWSRLCWLERNR